MKSKPLFTSIMSYWLLLGCLLYTFATPGLADGKKLVIDGCLLDSSCLFRKHLTTKISVQCAKLCGNAGSPLVILTPDGTVYWPIDGNTPAHGQNPRLIKYGGLNVRVTGEVYEKGGSKAIVIENIKVLKGPLKCPLK